jgi:hypothetical protein
MTGIGRFGLPFGPVLYFLKRPAEGTDLLKELTS